VLAWKQEYPNSGALLTIRRLTTRGFCIRVSSRDLDQHPSARTALKAELSSRDL
jgi:hypothetical protein